MLGDKGAAPPRGVRPSPRLKIQDYGKGSTCYIEGRLLFYEHILQHPQRVFGNETPQEK